MSKSDERLMERRTLDVRGIQLRDAETGDGSELSGIAVPFNTAYRLWSDYSEYFDRDTDFGNRKTVKISRDHGELIGKVTGMESQDDGLHITAKLSDTAAGRDAAQLVRDGVLDGFSVGFLPVENVTVYDDQTGMTEVHRRKVELLEVAVTGTPAYPDAVIQSQRHETITEDRTQIKEPEMDKELIDMLEGIKDEQRKMKASITKGLDVEPRKLVGSAYHSQGEYLRGLYNQEPEAIDTMKQSRDFIAVGDTGNQTTWIADDLRLIEQRRKVAGLLTHDSLPETGMNMEYNVVESDTMAAGKQKNQGNQLAFGKVKFGTKSTDVETYGGYTSLSRQTIERATTPMLNTALKALNNAYAKATEQKVRDFLYDLIANNSNPMPAPAAIEAMTASQWIGIILDAAEEMDDRNASLTRLAVSKDVAKALIDLHDQGERAVDISGQGSDTLGSFDLTGTVGDIMRVPIQLLPKAPAGTATFLDPQTVTIWESGGPTQLTAADPTKLVNDYSVYGYMAVAETFPDGLLPIKFAGVAA